MRKKQGTILVLLTILIIGCTSPLEDEVQVLEGVLGESDGFMVIQDGTAIVRYWKIPVPDGEVLNIYIKLNDGRWTVAEYALSNQLNAIFVYRIVGMGERGNSYRVIYSQ